MDFNKRYCKNRIRKSYKHTRNRSNHEDTALKDERQFKLDRFLKDVQIFKKVNESETHKKQKKNLTHDTSKESVPNKKIKRKSGLFDYGHMTTFFNRGMIGGPNGARFDQDLCKIIGLANFKNPKADMKLDTNVSNSHNKITNPKTTLQSPTGNECKAVSSATSTVVQGENKNSGSSWESNSYPEFTRMVNKRLALEKYKNFKNENYGKEIKNHLRNMYIKGLKRSQCEEVSSTGNSSTSLSSVYSNSSVQRTSMSNSNKENFLDDSKLGQGLQYKSATEYLQETLGPGSSPSPPLQRHREIVNSPCERAMFGENLSRLSHSNTSYNNYQTFQDPGCSMHIKHPVSTLPYPKEYLEVTSQHHLKNPVLYLPHPAAKYLDNHYVGPSCSFSNMYGVQRNFEAIGGCGDQLHVPYQHTMFPLPPIEPEPEFQHYPLQRF